MLKEWRKKLKLSLEKLLFASWNFLQQWRSLHVVNPFKYDVVKNSWKTFQSLKNFAREIQTVICLIKIFSINFCAQSNFNFTFISFPRDKFELRTFLSPLVIKNLPGAKNLECPCVNSAYAQKRSCQTVELKGKLECDSLIWANWEKTRRVQRMSPALTHTDYLNHSETYSSPAWRTAFLQPLLLFFFLKLSTNPFARRNWRQTDLEFTSTTYCVFAEQSVTNRVDFVSPLKSSYFRNWGASQMFDFVVFVIKCDTVVSETFVFALWPEWAKSPHRTKNSEVKLVAATSSPWGVVCIASDSYQL